MSFVELEELNSARVVQYACSTETVCIGWLIVFRLSSLELHVVKQYCCYSTHAAGQLMCHILVNGCVTIVINIYLVNCQALFLSHCIFIFRLKLSCLDITVD